jgi:nucleoside diphosphate kinase
MAVQQTLSIIKPDATRRNLTGKINAKFEEAGLKIVAQKRLQLTRAQVEQFYAAHKERGFFGELCDFMISGPVVVQVLPKTAILWAQPIRQTLHQARFAKNLPNQLRQIPYTAQTARKQPPQKLLFSLLALKSLLNPSVK